MTQEADGWWFGWIEKVPGVNCQERTRDELLASLRETFAEALELNREAAGSRPPGVTSKSCSSHEMAVIIQPSNSRFRSA
ncbi:MAG: hypothetical protein AAGI54_08630 [Planctomycetota bacterium]